MTIRTLLSCLTAALMLACVSAPAQAASSDRGATATHTAKKKKSSATTKTSTHSVKFINSPSEERTAERERRLKRECRGRPNAGACLGYAS